MMFSRSSMSMVFLFLIAIIVIASMLFFALTPHEGTPPSQKTASSTNAFSTTTPSATERNMGFITKVYKMNNKMYIDIDYAQMLTGAEADAAARAQGFNEGAPGGYWIRNENKKIRSFEVTADVQAYMTYPSHKYPQLDTNGVVEGKGWAIPFSLFYDIMNSSDGEDKKYQDAPYWISVSNNVVTSIEQQYQP